MPALVGRAWHHSSCRPRYGLRTPQLISESESDIISMTILLSDRSSQHCWLANTSNLQTSTPALRPLDSAKKNRPLRLPRRTFRLGGGPGGGSRAARCCFGRWHGFGCWRWRCFGCRRLVGASRLYHAHMLATPRQWTTIREMTNRWRRLLRRLSGSAGLFLVAWFDSLLARDDDQRGAKGKAHVWEAACSKVGWFGAWLVGEVVELFWLMSSRFLLPPFIRPDAHRRQRVMSSYVDPARYHTVAFHCSSSLNSQSLSSHYSPK